MKTRPERSEAPEYFFTYIDQVQGNDVLAALRRQETDMRSLAQTVSEERSLHRYAEGKWSFREVLGHINDTERVFAYRALWFARGFSEPLPSFDQDVAMAGSDAHRRSWASHVEDWTAVRAATRTLFEALPADAWGRVGTASGNPFTVRAMAYITAGHVEHHLRLLKERYLNA